MANSIQITGINEPLKKIQSIKLIREFLSEFDVGGHVGLKEAKNLVDNFEQGIPFPKLYAMKELSPEFKAKFVFEKKPSLKLFKVGVAPISSGIHRWEVVILSTDEATAEKVAMDSLTAKHSLVMKIVGIREITQFKNNTILATYTVA